MQCAAAKQTDSRYHIFFTKNNLINRNTLLSSGLISVYLFAKVCIFGNYLPINFENNTNPFLFSFRAIIITQTENQMFTFKLSRKFVSHRMRFQDFIILYRHQNFLLCLQINFGILIVCYYFRKKKSACYQHLFCISLDYFYYHRIHITEVRKKCYHMFLSLNI